MSSGAPTSVFKGAILTVTMRWTDRLIGFVSTLILARLLVPEDFGIVAMASLVVSLADVLLDLGVNVALIQNRAPTSDHYNTAWTLRLLQAAVAASVVWFAAPHAAIYFGETRIVAVLQVMAASLLLAALENIGIVTFQKEMRFGLDFRFLFFKRIVGFLATILAAWLVRSYWALVIGVLSGRAFGVLLSYWSHPMRPRLSLKEINGIFSVSQWMLVRSIGGYLDKSLHRFLVGRHSPTSTMGGYTLADEISAIPASEVLAPLNRVLFPAFVTAKHDPAELKRLFLLSQGVQVLFAFPASVGLVLVASDAVLVLLGSKWLFVVPFVQVLALTNVAQAIATGGGYVMLSVGKMRTLTLLTWIQIVLFAVGVFLVIPEPNAIQIAEIRLASSFVGFTLSVWMLMCALGNITLTEILRSLSRPILATALMTVAVIAVGKILTLPSLAAFFLKLVSGLVVYPSAVLLMWRAAGKPVGAESYLIAKFLTISGRT